MRKRRIPSIFVKRHVLGSNRGVFKDAFYLPLSDNKQLVEHKGRIYRNQALSRYRKKIVGVVGSTGRTGQAVQGAGTMIAPGNISPARSPIRSGIARALTPGGGRRGINLPNGPEVRGFRCAEGFQFGGRFTDANYSTCGKQLFDVPSLRETLGQAIYRTRSRRIAAGRVDGQGGTVEAVSGKPVEDAQLMIRRALRVTEVGPMSEKARETSIKDAVQALSNQDKDSSVLIRRDGFSMVPVVTIEELRGVPDNRNMEQAAFLKSVRDPETLGGDELGLLSNTGVTTLVYVTPNGVQLRLDRTRDLSTGERRQLGKDANDVKEMDISKDPLVRLNYIVDNTDGAFKLTKDFGNIKDPEEPSSEKDANGMPNWAYGAFKKAPEERVEQSADMTEEDTGADVAQGPAPEIPTAQAAQQRVAPSTLAERIDSLKEAVEHLNKGGLLADISPSIVLEALKRSNAYKEEKLRDDISLFESNDGKRVIVKDGNVPFEHLSAHLSSEVLRELGVQAPAVRFAGEGDDRPFLYRSPDGVVEGAQVTAEFDISQVPPEQVIGTQIADWLTDTRDRTKNSLFAAESDGQTELVVGVGPMAALVGLSTDELEKRRSIVLGDFFKSTTDEYGRQFTDATPEEKQVVIQILDQLITRAQEFSWGDYLEQLNADGKLSAAEKQHLEIVRQIFTSRLESLVSQRDSVLQILGA